MIRADTENSPESVSINGKCVLRDMPISVQMIKLLIDKTVSDMLPRDVTLHLCSCARVCSVHTCDELGFAHACSMELLRPARFFTQ